LTWANSNKTDGANAVDSQLNWDYELSGHSIQDKSLHDFALPKTDFKER
jgi:hypothetical protein